MTKPTQLQIAKVSFELKSETPIQCAKQIANKLTVKDIPYTLDSKGRIRLTTTSATNRLVASYKSSVKNFRKGGVPSKDILFPIRIGNISYINTIPTSTHLTMLFRHDSIMANNYSGSSKSSARPHHQPPFYFFVKVSIANGSKVYRIVNSPYSVENRMFPHNERTSNNVTSGCCDGGYADQLHNALKEDNLGTFLSIFGGYISDGTQRDDEYGRSCSNFTNDYHPQNKDFVVRDLLEAKIFAYSISDPEVPFAYNMRNQALSVKFLTHPVQKMFFSTVATLSDKVTAEEVIK